MPHFLGLFGRAHCTMVDASQYLPCPGKFVRIAGYQMHYLDKGSGPVVLMLHGNPTWCFYYRSLLERLSENYRVIVPDMLGCGLSDRTSEMIRARERMAHLVEFVDALELEKFSLVLHDWGGPIGTGMALERLDRVEKITYLNTTLTEIESLPSMIKTAASPLIGRVLTQYTQRFLRLMLDFGVVKKLSKQVREGYLAPYATMARRKAIWDFVHDIPFTAQHPTYQTLVKLASQLPQLRAKPIQIIWGLKDPCFHKEMLERVAAHFPDAEVHEFTDASHLVLEDKAKEVGDLLENFLGREQRKCPAKVAAVKQPRVVSELYKRFSETCQRDPGAVALIEPLSDVRASGFARVSREALNKLVTKYQRGFLHLGLEPGDKVLFLVPVGEEFIALVYAALACGAVPLFVDPGVGRKNLLRCIEDAEPDAFVSIPKGHLLKLLTRRGFKKCKFHVTVTNWQLPGLDQTTKFLKKFSSTPVQARESSGTELIAFTSGATGTPKGVVYTHEMTAALLDVLENRLGFGEDDIDMPLLPIFSLFNVALGVGTIFPPMDAAKPLELDPALIVSAMKVNGCSSSFGSPTLWKRIAEYCVRSELTIPSLKRILIAGAPVQDEVLEVLGKIVDPSCVFTPYGATEVLPVSLLSASQRFAVPLERAETGEQGTLVGAPLPEVEVKIVRPTLDTASMGPGTLELQQFEECRPGEIGEVIVRGAHVSPSYLNRPDAVHRGKIHDGASFWHRMGDVGYQCPSGNLYFCGRRAHAVLCQGNWFYSVPVERIFNQHKWVARSALVEVRDESIEGGRAVGLVVEPYPEYMPEGAEATLAFEAELKAVASSDPLTIAFSHFFFHPSFPVDGRHNAKIFRDKLGIWASNEFRKRGKLCTPSAA